MKAVFLRKAQLLGVCVILVVLLFGTLIYRIFTNNSNLEKCTPSNSTIKAVQVGTYSGVPSYRAECIETEEVGATPEEVYRAHLHGALGKVTLRVLDTVGQPVPDAQVDIGFVIFGKGARSQIGRTDRNGFFSAEGQVSWNIGWTITKDGYYRTVGNYLVQRAKDPRQLKDGRWQPWNPTAEVVLKEKWNPIKMIEGGWVMNSRPLPRDREVGFDFIANDYVAPDGEGKSAHVYFTLISDWTSSLNHSNRLSIRCLGDGGFATRSKDLYSEFQTIHEAPDSGYEQAVSYNYARTRNTILVDDRLSKNAYIIFKVQTTSEPSGALPVWHYGKITELDFGGGWIKFRYLFNPRPNDRNIEEATGT